LLFGRRRRRLLRCRVGLGDGLELLQVEPDDGVREEAGVVLGVALGDVDDVRLEHDGADPAGAGQLVDGGDGAVVAQAVLAAGDGEAEDPAGVVEEVEALGAGAGGEAGDDADLAEAAGAEGVAGVGVGAERAAADEVLVHLRAVEAADDGPDGARRSADALRQQRGALARPDGVAVVRVNRRPQLFVLHRRQPQPRRHAAVRTRALLLHRSRAEASSAFPLDWIRGGELFNARAEEGREDRWGIGMWALELTLPSRPHSAFSFFFKRVDRFRHPSTPLHSGLCHFYSTILLYFMPIAVSIFGL
jgi:hypothetical protein